MTPLRIAHRDALDLQAMEARCFGEVVRMIAQGLPWDACNRMFFAETVRRMALTRRVIADFVAVNCTDAANDVDGRAAG